MKYEEADTDLTREYLIKSLDQLGHRESALLLKNWNELDENANKLIKDAKILQFPSKYEAQDKAYAKNKTKTLTQKIEDKKRIERPLHEKIASLPIKLNKIRDLLEKAVDEDFTYG